MNQSQHTTGACRNPPDRGCSNPEAWRTPGSLLAAAGSRGAHGETTTAVPRLARYFTSTNLSFVAPQTGHFSGAPPTAV